MKPPPFIMSALPTALSIREKIAGHHTNPSFQALLSNLRRFVPIVLGLSFLQLVRVLTLCLAKLAFINSHLPFLLAVASFLIRQLVGLGYLIFIIGFLWSINELEKLLQARSREKNQARELKGNHDAKVNRIRAKTARRSKLELDSKKGKSGVVRKRNKLL